MLLAIYVAYSVVAFAFLALSIYFKRIPLFAVMAVIVCSSLAINSGGVRTQVCAQNPATTTDCFTVNYSYPELMIMWGGLTFFAIAYTIILWLWDVEEELEGMSVVDQH